MKFYVTGLLFLLSLNAFAVPQKIMLITNDIDTNLVTISVESNGATFKSIKKVETKAKEVVATGNYDLAQLLKGQAVQIKKEREVVIIRFDKRFDPIYGGPFVLDYLYSGISGDRENLVLDLRKNGVNWEVTYQNKSASKLHVLGNKKPVVGLIGISSIKVIN